MSVISRGPCVTDPVTRVEIGQFGHTVREVTSHTRLPGASVKDREVQTLPFDVVQRLIFESAKKGGDVSTTIEGALVLKCRINSKEMRVSYIAEPKDVPLTNEELAKGAVLDARFCKISHSSGTARNLLLNNAMIAQLKASVYWANAQIVDSLDSVNNVSPAAVISRPQVTEVASKSQLVRSLSQRVSSPEVDLGDRGVKPSLVKAVEAFQTRRSKLNPKLLAMFDPAKREAAMAASVALAPTPAPAPAESLVARAKIPETVGASGTASASGRVPSFRDSDTAIEVSIPDLPKHTPTPKSLLGRISSMFACLPAGISKICTLILNFFKSFTK